MLTILCGGGDRGSHLIREPGRYVGPNHFFVVHQYLFGSHQKLVNFGEQFQNGISGFDRFYELLQIAPDIVDARHAVELNAVKGDIAFEGVTFRYPGTTTNVLTQVNLNVAAGEYVALVGPSGVGKTTLCSLIPRFYEVTEGRITLDGIDIREIKLKSLRRKIGIVQQDVYLFAGSILVNIRYGKPEATVGEVIAAAGQCPRFYYGLAEGYETDIGNAGSNSPAGRNNGSVLPGLLKNRDPHL